MAKKNLTDKDHYTLVELVSVFRKVTEEPPFIHPTRGIGEISKIETRTMMLFKAKKICKTISNSNIGSYVGDVSKAVVTRTNQNHKKFLKENSSYRDKFKIFSEQVDIVLRKEKIRFS